MVTYGGAVGVSTAVVAIEVLVDCSCTIRCEVHSRREDLELTVKDKLVGSAKGVSDLDKEGTSLTREGLSGSPAATGEEEVVLSTSLADGVDGTLDGVDPGGDGGEVVRLVHDTENNALVGAVLLCELRPDALELSIGLATLSDDAAVPAGVVVLHIS